MAVTTGGGTRSLTRRSSTPRRATPRAPTTDMRRCATPQTRRPQTRCCGAPTAPRASTVTQAPPRPGTCMCTGSETGKGGPVTLHKKIHTTTVLFIVQIHILLIQAIIQAKLQMHLMILQMTGLNISALLGKNTTTIAEQKSHSGKNQKSGLKENRDKKKPTRWQLIASRKTGITEER